MKGSPLAQDTRYSFVTAIASRYGTRLRRFFTMRHSHAMTARLEGFVTGDVSHVGDSTTNTAALGYPLTRAAYTLANASRGVRWGRSELSLYAANLTNEHPNLADLNPAGYVRHTSLDYNAPTIPRVATLQPFNAGLQYRLHF